MTESRPADGGPALDPQGQRAIGRTSARAVARRGFAGDDYIVISNIYNKTSPYFASFVD